MRQVREYAGVAVKDAIRYRRAIRGGIDSKGNPAWVHLRNRNERLALNPDGRGILCNFKDSSRLHALKYFPGWSAKLFERAIGDWSISFADAPQHSTQPVVSFIIAHRGTDRLPQLVQTIRTIFAQEHVSTEVIVGDLSRPSIASHLPSDVNHIPIDDSHLTPGWRKAWAFNIAARQARGEVLVFQDGDICVPCGYSRELVSILIDREWQAASLQRFLFYLTPQATEYVLTENCWAKNGIEGVSQNWKGGTIAIRRNCFFEIGGFDEGFVDWGGEDDEFYDRCSVLLHSRYGYIPFVHLWHPPQAVRKDKPNPNVQSVAPWRLSISPRARCEELRSRDYGLLSGPVPREPYKDTIPQKSPASIPHDG